MDIQVVVQRQAELFQVVFALSAAGGFPRLLHCGQEQGNQDRDNRDDHEQLNQRKALLRAQRNHSNLPRELVVL